MRTRTLVALLLLPLALVVTILGGWIFALTIAVLLALASNEFASLFRAGGFTPSGILVAFGSVVLVATRFWTGFEFAPLVISLLVLLVTAYNLIQYERGSDRAASDFAISLAGIFYIGWLGSYMVSLRNLPEGMWWVMTVLPAVWAADTFAYLVGSRIGRHKMTPRLSPKKSWEGFFGGLIASVVITALLAMLWQVWAGPESALTPLRGAILGLAMGIFPTLGDLGESMIKRQVGVKDSGNLLPGHGGAFDRIDSWLWAAVIGYYVITWFFL